MAKFIVCDFHGTEPKNNPPVNLDRVQYFEKLSSGNGIEFNFAGTDRLVWEFEDSDARDEEYDRLISVVTDED